MNDQRENPKSGYRYDGEERDLNLRTYVELQSLNAHLRDIKMIGILLIATVAFPPIAWVFFVLAAVIAATSFFGKSMATIINKSKRKPNQAVDITRR
jgi:hypothetical protein